MPARKKEKKTPMDAEAQNVSSSPVPFWKKPAWVLFALAVLVYIQTVGFRYALDDKLYITHNQFTQQGIGGIGDLVTTDLLVGFFGKDKQLLSGGRYRQLPLVTFALEVELLGENPHVSHFLNILLYGFTCVLLFMILKKLLPPGTQKNQWLALPFAATLLFALHPIHTEVIANIKSRDEMMSLAGALGSLWFALVYLDKPGSKYLIYSFLCFLGGLLSKESTVTFLAATPFTLLFFRSGLLYRNRPQPASGERENVYPLKTLMMAVLPMFFAFGLYMGLRLQLLNDNTKEITELLNNPFVNATVPEKFATIFYTMGLYIKLLFFPHPLTNDYFPMHIPIIGWNDPRALVSLLIYAGLLIYAVRGIFSRNIVAWGIVFYLISFSLFSNLVFPIGSFMNERFMYVPSIGFCVAFAYLLLTGIRKRVRDEHRQNRMLAFVIGFIALAFALKTIARSQAWKDDFTLALTDVALSPNSTKANMSAGASLIEKANSLSNDAEKKALANEAIPYLNKALEIYPSYKQPVLLLGNAYYLLDQYNAAYQAYTAALRLDPNFQDARNNLEFLGDQAIEKKAFSIAENSYLSLLSYDPNLVRVYGKLGQLYGKDMGDMAKARNILEKGLQADPNNSDILQKLGIVYSFSGDNQRALQTFERAIQLNPKNAHVLMNMGITYRNMGDEARAEEYLARAFALDPSLKR